jgi:hypothetical protein
MKRFAFLLAAVVCLVIAAESQARCKRRGSSCGTTSHATATVAAPACSSCGTSAYSPLPVQQYGQAPVFVAPTPAAPALPVPSVTPLPKAPKSE